ncbi:M23 family metallopeptidase [Sulfitobacter sp. HNIBRBA3233]|uniref:M23 family metallopeptidase n=1 Tax=Sulfitobacter marinivivus TaxID=3158558 RepID=UPI0032DE91D2
MAGTASLALSACSQPLDMDLRGIGGGFTTADAAQVPLAERPEPDDRGVISYPNYQVAVARRGDTINDVASRVGIEPGRLASFNGIAPDVELRRNEIIALPSRVAEPSPATGAAASGPLQPVDIASVAGGAIDRVPPTPGVQTAPLAPATQAAQPAAPAPAPVPRAQEPIRHKVERGETAFTIARLYNVPVKDLAEWNGLGPDFAIRADQFLLIPVPSAQAPRRAPAPETAAVVPRPGEGSATPTPPSATKPLPAEKVEPAAVAKPAEPAAAPPKPVADIGKTTAPAAAGKLVRPVTGTIIRDYVKGKNEGINIKAAPGTPVNAADTGTVAAITKSADGIPIIVVRHAENLLTVYANVTDVSVAKGDSVSRGQSIAKLRGGDDSFVHFEVRKGFESVDPNPYLN